MVKFVSAYVERDKKILKNLFFAFAPLRKKGEAFFARISYLVFRMSLVEACGVVFVLAGRLVAHMRQWIFWI